MYECEVQTANEQQWVSKYSETKSFCDASMGRNKIAHIPANLALSKKSKGFCWIGWTGTNFTDRQK